MVAIVLCGLEREELSSLTEYLKSNLKILENHKVLKCEQNIGSETAGIKYFRESVRLQAQREKECQKETIFESCTIDTLVKAQLFQERASRQTVDDLVEEMRPCIYIYQRSLVVLLELPECTGDNSQPRDPTDKSQAYRGFLHRLHIPYLSLSTADKEIMKRTLESALKPTCPSIPLKTSTLQHYSSKTEDKQISKMHSDFSFYIERPKKESFVNIPTINVKEHFYEQTWTSLQKGETNRFTNRHGVEFLAQMAFDINVKSRTVQLLLKNGVYINGEKFSFLGCSASGLKERKCYLWKGTRVEAESVLQGNGNFAKITQVSKKMARIGLLFSGVKLTTVAIEDTEVIPAEDIENDRHCFTDGCGGIGFELAKRLYNEVKEESALQDYLPSVYQIRYQGYKGVVALDPNIPKSSILVRPSMKKFETTVHPRVGVCKYSQPYTFGHLNRQFIMLLSGLGIPDEVFLRKQEEHIDNVLNMTSDLGKAMRIFQWQNKFDIAKMILDIRNIPNAEASENNLFQTISKTQGDMMTKDPEKLRILIPKSRNIFGVCDPHQILSYGECFVRITLGGKPKTLRGQVAVCKSPCYLLSDVRVLTAVDSSTKPALKKLDHLVDCIVFPTTGVRPHSVEIAGSDLDGDEYFVTWDEDIIPPTVMEPYDYPGAQGHQKYSQDFDGMILYFSKQNEGKKLVGRVDRYFKRWADLRGVTCEQCTNLGMLFSRVIDAAKTGESVTISPGLVPPEEETSEQNQKRQYVWSVLKTKAMEEKENFVRESLTKVKDAFKQWKPSNDFVSEVVCEGHSNITEYEKFQFALTCIGDVDILCELYSQSIDFTKFTMSEKHEACAAGIPVDILASAFCKSEILTKEDIQYFNITPSNTSWTLYFSSYQEDLHWGDLVKAVTENDNVLFVLHLPDDVVVLLHFLIKCRHGEGMVVDPGTIASYFISRHYSYRYKYVLGSNYSLDLTNNTLQLYRDRNKNQTFVWLNASVCETNERKNVSNSVSKKRNEVDLGDDIVNAVSVDLSSYSSTILNNPFTRHPLVRKTPFVKLEVFACSRGKDVPYFDAYDANDLLPVEEIDVAETEDVEETPVDVEDMMKCNVDSGVPLTEEDFKQKLELTVNDLKLLQFQSFTVQWRESHPDQTDPDFVQEYTIRLLKNVFSTFPDDLLPDYLRECLSDIALSSPIVGHACGLEMLGVLCQLGMEETARRTCNTLEPFNVSLAQFLDLAMDWRLWWKTEYSIATEFLAKLLLETQPLCETPSLSSADLTINPVLCENADCKAPDHANASVGNVNEPNTNPTRKSDIEKYAFHYGVLQLIDFLQESEAIKKRIIEERSILSGISKLRFAKLENRDDDMLTLYRNSALDNNTGIANGQYIAICKHKDFLERPDLAISYCLAQVISIRLAPITITVRLLENPTRSIRLCTDPDLDFKKFWIAFPVANATLHTRIVDALHKIGVETKERNPFIPSDAILHLLSNPGGHLDVSLLNNGTEGFALKNNNSGLRCRTDAHSGYTLNAKQEDAVCRAIEKNVSFIQGPPGTGKTTVICRIVLALRSSNPNGKILVVTETNNAVDNIVIKLRPFLPLEILRIGCESGINNEIWDLTLDGQLRKLEEKEAKRTTYTDLAGIERKKSELIKQLLQKANVVLTTCAGSGDPILKPYTFESVLVDEATQTKETTLLCSLVHGAKHIVLIGDPKQLGPVISDSTRHACKELPNVALLSKTLFHRLYDKIPHECIMLEEQYRMHPRLMKFPSEIFYEGKLKSAVTIDMRLPIKFKWPTEGQPLCFIDVGGNEKRCGTSYRNTKEVEVVQEVINMILNEDEGVRKGRSKKGLDMSQITVLTTYQGQVSELKKKIRPPVDIRSVDSFQGRENECIIISTVRANSEGLLGFVDDRNRINVMLTRAKRGLVVVGKGITLSCSHIWQSWLEEAPMLKSEDLLTPCDVDDAKNGRRVYTGRGRGRTGHVSSGLGGNDGVRAEPRTRNSDRNAEFWDLDDSGNRSLETRRSGHSGRVTSYRGPSRRGVYGGHRVGSVDGRGHGFVPYQRNTWSEGRESWYTKGTERVPSGSRGHRGAHTGNRTRNDDLQSSEFRHGDQSRSYRNRRGRYE